MSRDMRKGRGEAEISGAESALPRVDAEGRELRVGDTVRIKGLPDVSGWTQEQKDFSLSVFEYLVGKYKKISDFNDLGMAEIEFRMKEGDEWVLHTVWLEPYLLRLKQARI